jgi:RimJ/RimL family protein N-acetyltransferase
MSTLIAASDDDFGWMLGEESTNSAGLRIAEGGIETPEVLAMLRALAAKVRASDGSGAWMIVHEDEVVGLISYMGSPENAETVEIGFGIAESRRRRGFVTRAVADLVALSRDRGQLRTLTAGTAHWNVASQKALARAGFAPCGTRIDEDDGELIEWRLSLV